MTEIYRKEFENDAVSFTFKIVPPLAPKLPHIGKIIRSDQPNDPCYDLIVIEGYHIELLVEAKDGRTIVTMDRKHPPSQSEELPIPSRASHQS